jgi:ubiquinone/menaquinone biosynthesis C-methylase UbiE
LKDAERIKSYWEERAKSDPSAQSTTLDYYMRGIEFKCISEIISARKPSRVFDVGCGDAHTTIRLAQMFPAIAFTAGDYAHAMLANARNNIRNQGAKNIEIVDYDITTPASDLHSFNLVYTTRCLINLSDWESQRSSLTNIAGLLSAGGTYVMIENFVDGHQEMNKVRRDFDLPEIKIRDHNCFFEESALIPVLQREFDLEEIRNISSTYYLITRVIYSKICEQNGVAPDYFDDHHRLAAQLPLCGNWGPVKMLVLAKK